MAITLAGTALSSTDEDPSPELIKVGQRTFIRCAACHAVEPGLAHKVGPNLYGVWGAPAASRDGFVRYSEALSESDIIWNAETLDAFLTKPSDFVSGTTMAFGGLSSAEKRAALIAYLKVKTEQKNDRDRRNAEHEGLEETGQ